MFLFLLFWTATFSVCLCAFVLPDDQPFCVSFPLVRDEICVLAQGEIFALVMDEIFLLIRDEICVLTQGEILHSLWTRFFCSYGTRSVYSRRARFLHSLWTRFLSGSTPRFCVGLTSGVVLCLGIIPEVVDDEWVQDEFRWMKPVCLFR